MSRWAHLGPALAAHADAYETYCRTPEAQRTDELHQRVLETSRVIGASDVRDVVARTCLTRRQLVSDRLMRRGADPRAAWTAAGAITGEA
jgi:hypothetical protein